MNVTEDDLKKVNQFFHQPPRMMNCAQSLMALQGKTELADAMANMGGGRAPDGNCGALHAAMALSSDDRKELVKSKFRAAIGSCSCREIKGQHLAACDVCIAAASKILDDLK